MADDRCRVCEPDTARIDESHPLNHVSFQLNRTYYLLSPPDSGGEVGDEPTPLTDTPWSLAQLGKESFQLRLGQAGEGLENVLLLELGRPNLRHLGHVHRERIRFRSASLLISSLTD